MKRRTVGAVDRGNVVSLFAVGKHVDIGQLILAVCAAEVEAQRGRLHGRIRHLEACAAHSDRRRGVQIELRGYDHSVAVHDDTVITGDIVIVRIEILDTVDREIGSQRIVGQQIKDRRAVRVRLGNEVRDLSHVVADRDLAVGCSPCSDRFIIFSLGKNCGIGHRGLRKRKLLTCKISLAAGLPSLEGVERLFFSIKSAFAVGMRRMLVRQEAGHIIDNAVAVRIPPDRTGGDQDDLGQAVDRRLVSAVRRIGVGLIRLFARDHHKGIFITCVRDRRVEDRLVRLAGIDVIRSDKVPHRSFAAGRRIVQSRFAGNRHRRRIIRIAVGGRVQRVGEIQHQTAGDDLAIFKRHVRIDLVAGDTRRVAGDLHRRNGI